MAYPARQRQVYRKPPEQPAPQPRPRLVLTVLPILIIGGLAMLHLVSLARLSQLEYEARRLERLSLEETMRRGDLMRQRAKLLSHSELWQFAQDHGMTTPPPAQPIAVGLLPAPKVYWNLPGEAGSELLPGGARIGLLAPGKSPQEEGM